MITIALTYSDGRIGVMQYYGADADDEIETTIRKMVDRPTGWKRITPEEARAIRAARPEPVEPEYQASVPSVSTVELDAVKGENAALKDRLAILEEQFASFTNQLRKAIAEQKAQA